MRVVQQVNEKFKNIHFAYSRIRSLPQPILLENTHQNILTGPPPATQTYWFLTKNENLIKIYALKTDT